MHQMMHIKMMDKNNKAVMRSIMSQSLFFIRFT